MSSRHFSLSTGAVLLLLALGALNPVMRAQAPAPVSLVDLDRSFAELSRQLTPAVVQILSNSYASVAGGEDSEGPVAMQQATGSGVLLSSDGYIATNAHVVAGASRVRVRLSYHEGPRGHSIVRPTGKLLPAKIIGLDKETDIALIKIKGEDLPHLSLGDSEKVRQGQIVFALGNPLGLENSVSMGVVSAVARQLKPDSRMIYIQTDTAINPGNSGGPLVDIDGQVVGLNAMIMTQSGGSEGIGLAVPSNILKSVIDQLKEKGVFTRGDIGVSARTISPSMAEALGLPVSNGVILEDVLPNSPAARGDLRIGDIVLSLDGKPMENARQFHVNIYGKKVDSVITVTVLRRNERADKKIVVQPLPDDPQRFASMVHERLSLVNRLGILGLAIDRNLQQMLPSLRRSYGILVARMALTATGPMGLLLPGDVIYTVDGQPVSTLNELRDVLDKHETSDVVVLQIERGGKIRFLEVMLD